MICKDTLNIFHPVTKPGSLLLGCGATGVQLSDFLRCNSAIVTPGSNNVVFSSQFVADHQLMLIDNVGAGIRYTARNATFFTVYAIKGGIIGYIAVKNNYDMNGIKSNDISLVKGVNPKVLFATPFSNNNYEIQLIDNAGTGVRVQSRDKDGFTPYAVKAGNAGYIAVEHT